MYEYERDTDRRRDPALKHYLRSIGRFALLDRDEEAALARRIRGGDAEALDRMVNANLRFVVSVAKQYTGRGLGLMDLVAEGNVGLITAARRFDERLGCRFITYASWWVKQTIRAALAEHPHTVRLPANRARDASRIARLERRLEQREGRPIDDDALAEGLGLDPSVVARIRGALRPTCGLDAGDEHHPAPADVLPDTATTPAPAAAEARELAAVLDAALAGLDDRDRGILRQYHGLGGGEPLSLEQIGAQRGLSRERVRQLRDRAYRRLRAGAQADQLVELRG